MGPVQSVPARQPDPAVQIKAAVQRAHDDVLELEASRAEARALYEQKMAALELAEREVEEALERFQEITRSLGDAAESYINLRYDAQRHGVAMPGETPRTVQTFDSYTDEDDEDETALDRP